MYSLSFTSYHFKLTMLLSKGKEVTKVPYFSSREREREREREGGREGGRERESIRKHIDSSRLDAMD